MYKFVKVRLFAAFSLILALGMMFLSVNTAYGQADPFSKVQEKLTGISEKERETVKNLFVLEQEIDVLEKDAAAAAADMEEISKEINNLQGAIINDEIAYEKKKDNLRQVLKTYQRMGPGTYIEIILDSDSLTTFLRRINILRDLTRNTGELLGQLEESKAKLTAQQTKLTEKKAMMENRKKQLDETLAEQKKVKAEKEKFLASLGKERDYYQDFLKQIHKNWDELIPLFSKAAKEFSGLLSLNILTNEDLNITFSFAGIEGFITEKKMNELIAEHTSLPEMTFNYYQDKVVMNIPDKHLVLSGKFVVVDGQILKYQVEEGTFFEMPLEAGTMEELFEEANMVLDLRPVLGRSTIRSIESKDGALKMSIIPNW